jgi:hypothetical protein
MNRDVVQAVLAWNVAVMIACEATIAARIAIIKDG